jgi:hypothetical protein
MMPFVVPLAQAQADYPEYTFIAPLTASEQKGSLPRQGSERGRSVS